MNAPATLGDLLHMFVLLILCDALVVLLVIYYIASCLPRLLRAIAEQKKDGKT